MGLQGSTAEVQTLHGALQAAGEAVSRELSLVMAAMGMCYALTS